MTVGTPGVEGEHGSEHTETDKSHREKELLPSGRDRVVGNDLEDIPCQRLAGGSRVIVDTDQTEHQESRAAHEHKGELHGRIVLVARAPHSDKEIHGYQRHLIEHEHGEEVD